MRNDRHRKWWIASCRFMPFHRPIYGSTHEHNNKKPKFQSVISCFFLFFLGRLRDSSSWERLSTAIWFFVFFIQKNIFFFLSKSPKQVNEVVVSLKKRKKEKRQSKVSPSLTMACCVCVIRLIHDRWIISPQPSRCSSIIKEKKKRKRKNSASIPHLKENE